MSGSMQVPLPTRVSGCVTAVLGGAALVLLAPAAAAARSFQRLRRGSLPRIDWHVESMRDSAGPAVVDVHLDLPRGREAEARRVLTDALVRVAESLRQVDDVYHLVYREAGEQDTVLVPVGPQIQDLAERVHLALSHVAWAGRTLVWLVLPRSRPLGEVVTELGWDPEAEGEPEALIRREAPRWAFALAFFSGAVATEIRLRLFLPVSAVAVVERRLGRVRASFV
jgi:hypothetical protein